MPPCEVRTSAMNSCRFSTPLLVKAMMALLGAGDDIDHFAIVDVVRISGDFFEQFKVLADPFGDVIYRANVGISPHQAA
jgi:hypothetical protein